MPNVLCWLILWDIHLTSCLLWQKHPLTYFFLIFMDSFWIHSMKIDFMSFASKSGEEYIWYSLLRNSSHFIWKSKTIFIFFFTKWQIYSYNVVTTKGKIWNLWQFCKKKFHMIEIFNFFLSSYLISMNVYLQGLIISYPEHLI